MCLCAQCSCSCLNMSVLEPFKCTQFIKYGSIRFIFNFFSAHCLLNEYYGTLHFIYIPVYYGKIMTIFDKLLLLFLFHLRRESLFLSILPFR